MLKFICMKLKPYLTFGRPSVAVLSMLLPMIFALSSCHRDEESQLKTDIDVFATAYFNWRFFEALPACTPSSRPWLSYMASQVTQADIDVLRAQAEGAAYEIADIQYAEDDRSATVKVTVRNFLPMDSIGSTSKIMPKAQFNIPVVRTGEVWKVELSGVLRSVTPRSSREHRPE